MQALLTAPPPTPDYCVHCLLLHHVARGCLEGGVVCLLQLQVVLVADGLVAEGMFVVVKTS